ncbi:MAG: DUF4365 domain-containing protein [Cyclobacteriaceae bacterium]|jgi:hypothetical protein
MGKIVNDTHVIGERGVIRFHDYCNNHFPYICFREVLRNDFGIDGEVELVRINDEGKKEMTGELLKVQIKSSFGSGYLRKRSDGTIYFNAKKVDLEYWSKYKLEVLLIIYDDETGLLYAKKIKQEDYYGAKKKSYPVDFTKENLLEKGKNNFVQLFSNDFKSRVSFEVKETLTSNLLYVKKHPWRLFLYDTKYSTKKEVYKHLKDENEAPYFTLYNKKIISGNHLKDFKHFCEEIITDASKPTIIEFEEVLRNQVYRRNMIELLNIIFKDFVGKKGIWYHKKYKRYYFSKPKDLTERSIEKKSIKTGKVTSKKVVTFHKYGKDEFYRHIGFELDYVFNTGMIYMVLNPKYLFTSDGKTTLTPKKITKYTNFLTSREWNDQVQDQLYQILNFISNSENGIEVVNTKDLKFHLTRFIHQDVKFGIPGDIPTDRTLKKKIREEKINLERSKQKPLF